MHACACGIVDALSAAHLDALDTKCEGQHFHDKSHHDFSFGLSGNRFLTF